jgi:hypothetical protein
LYTGLQTRPGSLISRALTIPNGPGKVKQKLA